jgi:putative peptidoglycan lipid II flippase
MKPIRLVHGFLTVGFWTLLSRIMGFARDILMAAYLGAGPVAEAFLVAQSLPNMFRRFFAEGAFNMAFVPMYAKKLEGGEDAATFARDAWWGMVAILTVFSLVGMAAMPWLVLAMASGFAGDARYDLAVVFGTIAFPYILLISLTALLSGILNAMGRFLATSAVPILMNAAFVAAMLMADRAGWDMGMALAWAVPVSGVLQLGATWIAVRRLGIRLPLARPRLTPDLRRLAVIAAPAVLAGGVVQVNLLVGRQVASFTEGAVAWLSYADRLYQLPLGVVGIAIGVVLLPDLSRRLRAGDAEGGRASFNRGAEFALFLTLPSAAALMVIALPIVTVLFQRGAFGPDDAQATALALAAYAAGLPAFVLQKVLQPLYYAREDTRSPFRFAVVSMVTNLGFALALLPLIGFVAAAVATSASAWVMVGQLWWGTRAMGAAARADLRFLDRLPRIMAATGAMVLVLWAGTWGMAGLFGQPGVRTVALMGLILAGMAAYFATAAAIGAMHTDELRAALRRRRGAPPPAEGAPD